MLVNTSENADSVHWNPLHPKVAFILSIGRCQGQDNTMLLGLTLKIPAPI